MQKELADCVHTIIRLCSKVYEARFDTPWLRFGPVSMKA